MIGRTVTKSNLPASMLYQFQVWAFSFLYIFPATSRFSAADTLFEAIIPVYLVTQLTGWIGLQLYQYN